jgi:H+/Cl- antiporter ClcA
MRQRFGVSPVFHLDWDEHLAFLKMLVKWVALGSVVGVLAGTASAVFLITLNWATGFRVDHPSIIFLLPAAGFAVGWAYYRYAGPAIRGNNLVIETVSFREAQRAAGKIPLRMAPMVLAGTIITHLFGGSAGREGTAIQMGASLADGVRRALGLNEADRRLMVMAGISGGFGSVFGTPIAGFVFGMEVQNVGQMRYEGIVPCLTAALVGDLVTRAWGATHSHYPHLADMGVDGGLLAKVALAGIAFGLASLLFIELTHLVKRLCKRFIGWQPLYPVAGGIAIIALTLLLGTQDYLGLSLPLIQRSVTGEGVVPSAFLLKIIFTAITLGTGFLGGEVTPLFVIGSTLGYALAAPLGLDPAFLASIGFVAVFAGASNTPLACALMGLELFGGGSPIYLALGCFIAYLASGHRGIYVTQVVGTPKAHGIPVNGEVSLEQFAEQRRNGDLNPPAPR